MPGIFDTLIANGILSQLFGGQAQAAAPAGPSVDTGDDTQRMLKKQQAILSGAGSVTNPPVPLITQAEQNNGVPAAPMAGMPTEAPAPAAPPVAPPAAPIVNAAGTTQTPGEFAPFQEAMKGAPGILDRLGIKTDHPVGRLGNFLMAAGSKNPAEAMAELQKLDAEIGRPKVTPLAGGAFSMVTKPDGTQQIVKNEDVAKYLADQNDLKKVFELLKIDRRGEVQKGVDLNKSDIKTDAEARPLLNDTETLIGRWKQAADMIKGQGTWSQVQGAFPTIAGFFGTDDAAKNKFLQGLTVDETLLNTAKTKGAISDREMALFKTPIPALTDDREKVWKPYIESRLPVLEKLKNFYESQVARGEKPGASTPAAPKASSGGSDYEAQAKSAWGSYDPDQYEYRMNNGVLQRRKK